MRELRRALGESVGQIPRGSRLLKKAVALGRVSRSVCFGLAKLRGLLVPSLGLGGAGQFGCDVGGFPGLFAFERPDPEPKLAVAQLGLVAAGLGSAERPPRSTPTGVGLDLLGLRSRTKRDGVVLDSGKLALSGHEAGLARPFPSQAGLVGDGAEGLDGPGRLLRSGDLAELLLSFLRSFGEVFEVPAPCRVSDRGDPVGVGAAGRFEGDGVRRSGCGARWRGCVIRSTAVG